MPQNKLGYNKPPEPKFIREMKAKLGYRAPDDVDSKLQGDAGDFDDRDGEILQFSRMLLMMFSKIGMMRSHRWW